MNNFNATSTTPLATSERDRLGSIALDQWRGLALLLVLISHGFFFTDRVNGIGRVGVNLFFFISGILVFRSLTRTRAKTSFERAKSFWWRRLRRLYPAMIAYTLVMLPFTRWFQDEPNLPPGSDLNFYVKSIPFAFFYLTNYFEVPMALGHLWSLACEMQFYLLAPIIYLLGGTTITRKNLIFGFLLAVLLALGLAQPFIGKWKYHFEFAVWPMMLGFGCEYKRDCFQKIPLSWVTFILWSTTVICGASLLTMLFGMEMKLLVIATGALLLAPCLMAYLFGRPMPQIFGPAMKWLGERTYSIYLWQQPFTICNFLPNILHPLGAIIAIGVGGIWFRFFEWPFLTTSRRVMEKAAVPRKNLRIKIFLVAAGIIFTVSFLFAWILRAQYETKLRQQIWPINAPQISVVSNSPAYFKSTVLLLGDSRMAQWHLPQLFGWRVVNAGTSGLTTGQILLAAPKLLDEFHPDVVVLEAGINDLKFLGLRPEISSQIISLALSNCAAMADDCVQRGDKIILLQTWPSGKIEWMRHLVWDSKVPLSIAEFNLQLEKLDAPQRKVCVVDLFKAAQLKPQNELYRDALHFKPAVYDRLTPFLETNLNTILGLN